MTALLPTVAPRRVLVADDDPVIRIAIRRTLLEGGYAVEVVSTGTQLREALLAENAPRLVLTDWLMPGASGVEISRELRMRPEGGQFYVIVVTGCTTPADVLEALEAGADDYVPKPFTGAELLARVNAGRRIVELQEKLEARIADLAVALAEVRTLRGLIPICMHCHRIRSDADGWQKLEGYLEAHSEALLSHALCDECLETYYPEDPAESTPGDTPPAPAAPGAREERRAS